MNDQQPFRWIFIVIFVVTVFISGYFRRKARQSGDVIRRAQEGPRMMLGRVLVSAPLYLPILAYMVNPAWMSWSMLSLPTWLRWLAAFVALGLVLVLYWVMTSIGTNVSETYLTKERHVLVTHGPYRWVRHPLYAVATGLFISLSLLAANWFILAMALVAILGITLVVIPREEAQLTLKFGDEYRRYQQRTGRLFPRLGRER